MQAATKEAIRFGRSLHRPIDRIFAADPAIGLTFVNMVDLAYAYIRIWVRLEDVPAVAFLVPREKDSEPQFVGFHLSILMGYVYFSPLFFAATKIVKDLALNTLHAKVVVPGHPL